MTDKTISEVVQEFVDDILCRVHKESDQTDRIRNIAQRIVEELILEANDAISRKDSGAGDINGVKGKVHHPNTVENTQQSRYIEGQSTTEVGYPNATKNGEQLVSDKTRRSSKALCINRQMITQDDITSSHQVIERKYVISRETNGYNEPCITWESMYPKYALVKVVKISKKERIIHSNGVLDNKEVKRIVNESDKILKKKNGHLSVARKFFRRMLGCFSAPN